MVSVARSGGNQIAVGCACVGGEEVQTECEGYLFDSFGCKAVKRGKTRNDKVRAMGREDYVRMGGVGCFCAGRRERKGKRRLTERGESVPESFEGDGQDRGMRRGRAGCANTQGQSVVEGCGFHVVQAGIR